LGSKPASAPQGPQSSWTRTLTPTQSGTLSITMPLPASAGLTLVAANLVLIYQVFVKATGEYLTGIVTKRKFSGFDQAKGTVTIGSAYFGRFQTAYIDILIEKKFEAKKQRG
jgi:hypothetical protein